METLQNFLDLALESGWAAEAGKHAGVFALSLLSFWVIRKLRGTGKAKAKEIEVAEEAPPASEALAMFLRSLHSEVARYDPASNSLEAPGLVACFDRGGFCTEILVTDEAVKLTTLLAGGESGGEWFEATGAASKRRDEIRERDRLRANRDAAIKLGKAHLNATAAQGGFPTSLPAGRKGQTMVYDGERWVDGGQAERADVGVVRVLNTYQPRPKK